MSSPVHYLPKGYQTAIPYLIINGAARAIEFYCQAFGAKEMFRMGGQGGAIGHAEIKIDDCVIMLADECPQMGTRAPGSYGGTPVFLCLYVKDCEAVLERATARGAKILKPVQDQFYGDRSGSITDPFGHVWTIATHIEDVTPEEIAKRAAALFGGKPS